MARCPSDAQARLLALIADHEAEGRTVEWWVETDPERPSVAHLSVEVVDRARNIVEVRPARNSSRGLDRVATVNVCLRHGWLDGLHERMIHRPWTRGQAWLRQLDMTEDGTIALGLWRERKLASPPAPLPELSERETEIVALAQRALDLGYALCAREPARLEAARIRRAGWFTHGGAWVANSAHGLVPTATAIVEVLPARADDAAIEETREWRPR